VHADLSRRQWIQRSLTGVAGLALAGGGAPLARAAASPPPLLPPAENEPFWSQVQQAFVVDREVIDLNHAGAGCAPRPVLDAVQHYVRAAERLPSWDLFQSGPKEPIRTELAAMFGCDREEIAIVRNATEALDTVLLGLPLRAGDEVLTTTLDYWAMLDALDQRAKRDGIVVRQVRVPVPPQSEDELLQAFADALTERTKLILVSHPVNLTGQHFPVARISELAHARGVEVLVDAAQSFGQLEITAGSLQCDYMGASLHKWLMGPKGTGVLYVQRDKIQKIWPLIAAGNTLAPGNIRKFELKGTAPMTEYALAEAIRFHRSIGLARIRDRLRHLTRLWADALRNDDRFEFRTSFAPDMSNAIATFHLKGTDSGELWERLFRREKIFAFNVARRTKEFQGLRVSVGLATTVAELDRFVATMQKLARERPSRGGAPAPGS